MAKILKVAYATPRRRRWWWSFVFRAQGHSPVWTITKYGFNYFSGVATVFEREARCRHCGAVLGTEKNRRLEL